MASPPNSAPIVPAKIFCGGLCDITTNASLRTHFSPYGEIVDSVVLTEKSSGRSRGFGFITFASEESVDAVLASPQTVDGKEVDCKRAIPRGAIQSENSGENSEKPQQVSTGTDNSNSINSTKIFVGGLPQSCTDEKLRAHFEKYGVVKNLSVMIDRDTSRHRGFGFVEYESPESVEEVMRHYYDHKIDNKWVECKKALPREIMAGGANSSKAKQATVPPIGYADYYRNTYIPMQQNIANQHVYGRYARQDPRYMYPNYGYPAQFFNGYNANSNGQSQGHASLPLQTSHLQEMPMDSNNFNNSTNMHVRPEYNSEGGNEIVQQTVGITMPPSRSPGTNTNLAQRPVYTALRAAPYMQGRYAPTGTLQYPVSGGMLNQNRVRGIY